VVKCLKGRTYNATVKNNRDMRRKKAKFSWGTFGITLGICVTIGFPIVSYTSPLPLEFRNNSITLISISLLLSITFASRSFIQNMFTKVWMAFAKNMVRKYIENQITEYSSQIPILGLTNNSGTVNLILGAGFSNGVSPGAMLDVVTDPAGEIYGEVQVVQISNSRCTVSPTNRINSKFWEKLEDRMKYDPSSPPNIVAKRQIPDGIMEFLKTLL